ncbi:hypothetical protein [Kribbia dieselivorans]|uniref:hypothetical protein n=1 Tax=Kribbia dieselivorans TaxID=331526 RepID=UPI0008388EF9|nr:hypothetical protein [Kribbia dieselivorans]
MLIECTACPVQGLNCGDCVVTELLTPTGGEMPLDAHEARVVSLLVDAGLVSVAEADGAMSRREPFSQYRAAVG